MSCKKRRYRTDVDAMIALARTKYSATVRNNHHRQERKFYKCPKCKGWHLTSK